MKCPNCGFEMKEEHLYCEKCGMEIQIVPDFEPEIENSITETLSTVAEEIEGKKEPEPEKDEEKEEADEFFKEESGRNWLLISSITLIAVAVAVAFTSLFMYHRYSVSYQVETARKYAEMQKYEEAVAYLDRARALETENAEIVLLESSYYYQMGNPDKAAKILLDLIEKEYLTYEDKEKAYDRVISIYSEQGKYVEINDLLLNCEDEDIVTLFQSYLAMEPEFSYEGGSYDEVIPLKLSANTTGRIFYTMDGSLPDENSMIYTSPIFLESGEYQVTAVFINEYGIKSLVKKNWYKINLTVPHPPEVLLYSGEYSLPAEIEVAAPAAGKVFYTTDGTKPNSSSLEYTEPIPVPLGRSNFQFIVISEEGVPSEIISRSYDFKLDTNISADIAIKNVKQALIERNVLLDMQGHAHGTEGKYTYQYFSVEQIGEGYYYILNEFYEDKNGNQDKTEHLYAVEVYTGAPNRLIYDENGEMGLISLQNE